MTCGRAFHSMSCGQKQFKFVLVHKRGHTKRTMEMHIRARKWERYVHVFLLLTDFINTAFGVTHYSIPEEMEE